MSKLQQESVSLFSFSTLEAHFPIKSSQRSTCLPLPRSELGQHFKFQRCEPPSGALLACGNSLGPQKPAVLMAQEAQGKQATRTWAARLDATYPNPGHGVRRKGEEYNQSWEEAIPEILPQTLYHPCPLPPLQPTIVGDPTLNWACFLLNSFNLINYDYISHFTDNETKAERVSFKPSLFGPKSKLFPWMPFTSRGVFPVLPGMSPPPASLPSGHPRPCFSPLLLSVYNGNQNACLPLARISRKQRTIMTPCTVPLVLGTART